MGRVCNQAIVEDSFRAPTTPFVEANKQRLIGVTTSPNVDTSPILATLTSLSSSPPPDAGFWVVLILLWQLFKHSLATSLRELLYANLLSPPPLTTFFHVLLSQDL